MIARCIFNLLYDAYRNAHLIISISIIEFKVKAISTPIISTSLYTLKTTILQLLFQFILA